MKPRSPFTVAVMQGLDAVQYLSNLPEPGDEVRGELLAEAIGASPQMLSRTLMILTKCKIIEAKRGPGGGFRSRGELLRRNKVSDLMKCLGQEVIEPQGYERGSDRLNAALFDVVNVSLEEFLS